ncbi:epoxyqueuosine reductase [Carboxylicivirga linearis]|uniref:Epoxyqueuosine reductase n=1 Tax=Carboxylicivirga linearis TaxID=1628157 RepID=A0ABS5JWL2_9BACT|nr:epoxyqueuosine reductase [Carboxylicivirga linearis]MBS2099300.1 epoxyqueuosine reductase [Carboxylicivirga linearis]
MKLMNQNITEFLSLKGIKIVRFVDVSHLNPNQTLGYKTAILFAIPLSVGYVRKVYANPDYVRDMIRHKEVDQDEFNLIEKKTDRLADEVADYLISNGYKAYSQSERNIEATHRYNQTEHRTPLPHKILALKAGMGWIGKHNLLVNTVYGSALSMCSVLTNAKLETRNHKPSVSKCGDCMVCVKACAPGALNAVSWNDQLDRDDIVNIRKCTTCIQCMMACPWTQKYAMAVHD